MHFGRILEGFWEDFWKDLTLQTMIRATKGISRRPNHMPSHLDAQQSPGPVDFRRLPGDLHSVVKQASFSIAFSSNFFGFVRPKSMPKFDFRTFFFDVIFESISTSKFGRFWEAQNQKNSNFLEEKQRFLQNHLFR